jgi:hypothetical protein
MQFEINGVRFSNEMCPVIIQLLMMTQLYITSANRYSSAYVWAMNV